MRQIELKYHLIFWISCTLAAVVFRASSHSQWAESFTYEILGLPLKLAVVYSNIIFLMPKYIFRPKFFSWNTLGTYFMFTGLIVLFAGFFQRLINYKVFPLFFPDTNNMGIWITFKFLQSTIIIAFPLLLSIFLAFVWKISQIQAQSKNLEHETIQTELKYLKSQINPHFLFNTLNNLYGLSLERSEKTAELILKLSNFLSFSLYENNKSLISISKEIKLLKDFIDLEMSRFEDRLRIEVSLDENIPELEIPPLILVPFVENAFKHSLKNETDISYINISLSVKEGDLIFKVSNSKNDVPVQKEKSGLGLKNTIKRLDLLYDTDYTLDIDDEPTIYTTVLKIKM